MNKYLLLVFASLFVFSSCKSKKNLVKNPPVSNPRPAVDYGKTLFLKKTDSSNLNFLTFSARGKAEISVNGSKNSASINIRIKKDQIIWVYISLGFIPVAQAYITPDSVKVKNLIQGGYIHKDFGFIRQYSSSLVDFQTLQAILTGNTAKGLILEDDLYKILSAGNYQLSGRKDSLDIRLGFNSMFKTGDIFLNNPARQQNLHVAYQDFTQVNGSNVPQTIDVKSHADSKDFSLNLSYKKIGLNEELEFPFNAPGN